MTAAALQQQRQIATDQYQKIAEAADAIVKMGAEAEALRVRARARVSATVGNTTPSEEESTPSAYANRPGMTPDDEKLRAREVELTQELQYVDSAVAEANDTRKTAESDLASILREINYPRIVLKVSSLDSCFKRIEERQQRTAKRITLSQTIAAEIDTLADRVAEDQRRKEEEERLAREEKERREREAEDASTFKRQRNQMLDYIRGFLFEDAHEQLSDPHITYHTDEARARHQLMVEQCAKLVAMKSFVLESLSTAPFAWGWRQDGSPRDITGATRTHVLVGDHQVPWREVSLSQLSYILNAYVCGEKVKPTLRANYSIAASILFAAHGQLAIAESLLKTGICMQPSSEPEATRLAQSFLDSMQ